MATHTSPVRPPLNTKDTFDAPQLVGRMSGDGIADLTANHAAKQNGTLRPAQEAVETHDFGTSSSASPAVSVTTDEDVIESYDDLEVDADAIISHSTGLLEETLTAPTADIESAMQDQNMLQRQRSGSSGNGRSKHGKRNSIQIRLEKTDRKGRYILRADDPEIRDILRKGIEREEAVGHKPRARFRDLVFTRQFTTFDRQNPASADSPFFGFFTLFWLGMVLIFFRVAMHNWRDYGSVLGNNEIMKMMFSREVLTLGITDGVMCGSTAVGLLLQKAIYKDYIRWAKSGWVIQNIWQSFYLACVIWWTWFRDWPWTHTIFVVLHALVFLMKQHSYAFYNGYLSGVYRRRALLQSKLKQLEEMEPADSAPNSPIGAIPSLQRPFSSSSMDLGSRGKEDSLKKRRRSMGPRTSTNFGIEKSDVAHVASAIESGKPLDSNEMQAFARVINAEVEDLTKELNGKSTTGKTAYPKNLTLYNFAEWTCLPTLVYELEYPRQEKINWWYVAEKSLATFGVIGVMMVISQAYIYPPVEKTIRMKEAGMTVQERWKEFPWILSDMLFPLLLEQLLTWYVIWECVLNVLAEVTCFADRGFYGDWWNSVSWDQYARDWNRPVHNFLLRHVYHSSISTFHLSRSSATFITFLLSALVHELVMACLFKKVRGYLFTMQLLQMPLVTLSRTKLMKGRTVLGNVVFWVGLFVGPSFLTSLYLII